MDKKEFIKNIIGYSTASYIGAVLSFVSIPIVTRLFDAVEMGKINLFLVYVSMISIFCFMGYDSSLVRFYNEPPEKQTSASLSAICLMISMIFYVIIALCILIKGNEISLIISGIKGYFIPICLVLSLLGNLLIRYTTLISRMSQKVLLYSIQSILLVVITKFIYVFSALINPNHKLAIVFLTTSYVVLGVFFVFWFIKLKLFTLFFNLNKTMIITLSKYALPIVPAFFILTMNNSLSQLFLKKYVGYSAIGIYSNAISIAGILSLVQSGFNIYWPAFVFAYYKTEMHKIKQAHYYISYIMFLTALIIILFQDIIYILVGHGFRGSKFFFPLLLVSPVVYTIAETTRIGIRIAKKTFLDVITSFIILIANFILCIVLIPLYGVCGAAWSSAISAIIGLIIITILGCKYYPAVESYMPMILGFVVMFCAAIFNFTMFNMPTIKIPSIIILIIILTYIYRSQSMYLLKMLLSFKKNH